MKETLIRIELPYACFCFVSRHGVIVEAAPMGARWTGAATKPVADWYKRRGAKVMYKKFDGEWQDF